MSLSKKQREALRDLTHGYNCAQSVIHQYVSELNIDEKNTLKIAHGFGGGMRCGTTCGAVSGSVMALGLLFGSSDCTDLEAKERVSLKVKAFMKEFKLKHNTTQCIDLLGIDISTPEGRNAATEADLFKTNCAEYIKTAIELIEKAKEEL